MVHTQSPINWLFLNTVFSNEMKMTDVTDVFVLFRVVVVVVGLNFFGLGSEETSKVR